MPFDEKLIGPAWEDNRKRSNDIIILGKRYPLVKRGEPRVINFLDNPALDFRRLPNLPIPAIRPRPGNPQTIEKLKEAIQFCVIHTDMAKNALQTYRFLHTKRPIPNSTHFCINWNGDIYQYADIAATTFHAGNVNKNTIGIDMNGMLVGLHNNSPKERRRVQQFKEMQVAYRELVQQKLEEKYQGQNKSAAFIKRMMDDYEFQQPQSMKLRGSRLRSYGYTERQYQSLISLMRLLVRELDIDKTYPMLEGGRVVDFTLPEDEHGKLKGMVAHWHLSTNRWDPGPGFDWEKVLAGIINESNAFPVAWGEGHRIRGARDKDRVEQAAYELARNPELSRRGGTYPIGPNQTWHGGIHLYPPALEKKNERRVVRAMFDGVVVAAHFEPGSRELGHNNFVLLRHDIELPKRKAKLNEDGTLQTTKLRVFSLYMHLSPMNVGDKNAANLADNEIPWVQRLYVWPKLAGDVSQALTEAIGKFEEQETRRREEEQLLLEEGEEIEDVEGNKTVYLDEDEVEELKENIDPYLKVGTGTGSLAERDSIAILVSDELEVKVLAGEGLGFVGETVGDDEDDRIPTLHVEVFCSQNAIQELDLDAHAQYFRTPQRARGSDLTVRTQDILSLFGERDRTPYGAIQVWPERRVENDVILDFFFGNGEGKTDEWERYRDQLRKSITYHVSEWSDQVDWVSTLTGGKSWGKAIAESPFQKATKSSGLFSQEIQKFLPFIWLTEDVATQVGLLEKGDEWDGRVYHFHPIWFLMWVTYHASKRRIQSWTRMSYREVLRQRRRETEILRIVTKARENEQWRQRKLEKALKNRKLYLDGKSHKPGSDEYQALREEVLARLRGDIVAEDDEGHGIVAESEPMFGSPREVLRDLFGMPGSSEWTTNDQDEDE